MGFSSSVSVLGSKYRITYTDTAHDSNLKNCDGYCDRTSRSICVSRRESDSDVDDFDMYARKVLRHEIVHAFMYESGLGENWEHRNFGQEETVVDWIASQGPKIIEAWVNAGALDKSDMVKMEVIPMGCKKKGGTKK
jgi:hypothetical protein